MVARGGVVCVLVILMFAKGYRSVKSLIHCTSIIPVTRPVIPVILEANTILVPIFKFQCYIVRVELENPHKTSSIDILLIFCIWIFTICTRNYI